MKKKKGKKVKWYGVKQGGRKRASKGRRRGKSGTTKKRRKMFDIDQHNSLEGFQKLGYIADELGITYGEIAEIVEEDPSVIRDVLKGGKVPPFLPNAKQFFDKLYLLRTVFSSLLRLAGYSETDARKLLTDTTEFKQCIEQPPWYPQNLIDYIITHKTWAVRNALLWLRKY